MTQMNLSTKQEQSCGHRKQSCSCQGGGGWGKVEREIGVSRCGLLYTEWINNKVLLYSTENYIPYPMINHNGKEYKNVYIICIIESLCYTAEINCYNCKTILQHCKSAILHFSFFYKKTTFLVKVETEIRLDLKSRFGIMGFSTSDTILGMLFFSLTP